MYRGIGLILILALAAACRHPAGGLEPIDASPGQGLARWVDVFVGTDDALLSNAVTNGAGGSTNPAAATPFGMVQWGPDTPSATPAGYKYSDSQISGFSLTHIS